MGWIANRMALELFFKIKRRIKEKRKEESFYAGGDQDGKYRGEPERRNKK